MKRIILASTSPWRRELLARLHLPFTCEPPGTEEIRLTGESPAAMVWRLAQTKARAVAARHPDALVIGSDQCAEMDGEVLGKPGTHERAVAQLRRCSGRTVVFHTGLSLIDTGGGREWTDCVEYRVRFRPLDDARIESYLRTEKPYDCAGSFKSEGLGISLFAGMEGNDPTALIGLPLIRLVDMLEAAGLDILPNPIDADINTS